MKKALALIFVLALVMSSLAVSGAEELVRDDAPAKKKPAAAPEQPTLFVK